MTGVPQDQGILPRCLDVLFNSIGELQTKKYVSMFYDIQLDKLKIETSFCCLIIYDLC